MFEIVVSTYDQNEMLIGYFVVVKDTMPTPEYVVELVMMVQSDAERFAASVVDTVTKEVFILQDEVENG